MPRVHSFPLQQGFDNHLVVKKIFAHLNEKVTPAGLGLGIFL